MSAMQRLSKSKPKSQMHVQRSASEPSSSDAGATNAGISGFYSAGPVLSLVPPVQAKQETTPVHDPFQQEPREQESDATATQAKQMESQGDDDDNDIELTGEVQQQSKSLQRKVENENEDIIQAEQSSAQTGSSASGSSSIHSIASEGLRGAERGLPGQELIQSSFGRHDISNTRVQVSGPAEQANERLGSRAYTRGDRIAFKEEPDLKLAAHEAAHVVQQRRGVRLKDGIGRPGDKYEQQADAVAERVVTNQSAEDLLNDNDGEPQSALQTKCDCGGTCSKCVGQQLTDEEKDTVQMDLEVNATRVFEPMLEGSEQASAGGGSGREGGSSSEGREGGGTSAEGGETRAEGGDGGAEGRTGSEGTNVASGGSRSAVVGGGSSTNDTGASDAGPNASSNTPPSSSEPNTSGGDTSSSAASAPTASTASPSSTGGGEGTTTSPASSGGTSGGDASSSVAPAPATSTAAPSSTVGGGGTATSPTGSGGAGGATPQCYRGKRDEPTNPPDTQPANPPQGEVQHQTNEGEDEEVPEADNCTEAMGASSPLASPDAGTGDASAPVAAEGVSATTDAVTPAASPVSAGGGNGGGGGIGGGAALMPVTSPMDGMIASAEEQRSAAVAAYASSRNALAGASSGTAALRVGVGFVTPSRESVAEASARRTASVRAERFFNSAADRLDVAIAGASGAIPDQLGVAAESGKAQIVAALESEKNAISSRIEQARGQTRSDAALASTAVRTQAASYMNTVRTQTTTAIANLRAAHQAANAQVNLLETTTLDQINQTYAKGRTDLEGVGTTIGDECTSKGAEFAAKYRSFDTCTENGFWDGDLSQRRAEAQAKAAEETAKGYHDRIVSGARTRAREATRDGRKANRCLIIQAATKSRDALDNTLTSLISAMEQSRDAALTQAASARDQLIGSIHRGTVATLAQLDQQEYSQRQTADDTAYIQQVLQEQMAHAAAAAIQNVVVSAVNQTQSALASVQVQFNRSKTPDLAALEPALSLVEERLNVALSGLDNSAEGGVMATEGRLSAAAGQGVSALAGVTQGNADQVQSIESGFTQSMSVIAGRDNFANQRRSFTQQMTQSTSAATATFTQVVSGVQKTCTDTLATATQTLTQAHTDLETNLRQQRQGLEGDMVSKADEAASHEAPAWKTLVAVLLIIVVVIIVIVVIVASGGAALAPLGALMTALGPLLTGAIVGAITSGLIYMATNLLNNEDITWGGLALAVVIGAATGAIGGGLGARAGAMVAASALKGAAQVAGQFVAALAVNVGLDVVTQFVMGRFSFEHFSYKQLGITVLVTVVTFGIGHATARPRVPVPAGTPPTPEPLAPGGQSTEPLPVAHSTEPVPSAHPTETTTPAATPEATPVTPEPIPTAENPEPVPTAETPEPIAPHDEASPVATPDEIRAAAHEERLNELARDPDHGGAVSDATRAEAEAGLGLEGSGELPGPIRRPVPGDGHSGDFVDGHGNDWDVKAPRSRENLIDEIRARARAAGRPEPRLDPTRPIRGEFNTQHTMAEIRGELAAGENVIVDTRGMNPADLATLRTAVQQASLGDRVKFYP